MSTSIEHKMQGKTENLKVENVEHRKLGKGSNAERVENGNITKDKNKKLSKNIIKNENSGKSSTDIKKKKEAARCAIKHKSEAEKRISGAKKLKNKQQAAIIKADEKLKNKQNAETEKTDKKIKNDIKKSEKKQLNIEKRQLKKENALRIKEEKRLKVERENEIMAEEAERFAHRETKLYKLAKKFGKTQFEVTGTGFARLISALAHEFNIEKTEVKGARMTFFAESKHSVKIIALLDNLCYNYKIINIKGVAPTAISIFGRAGILLGAVAVVAVLVVYPHFITKIEVDGTLNGAACDILESNGISEGGFLWDDDCGEVSKRLQALDGIAFASVEKRGTHVYVTLKGEQDDNGFVDITSGVVVAKMRASVSRIIVLGGTAVVKYGDVVDVGDTLIADFLEVGDTKVTVPARGEVYGKVYHTLDVYFPDMEVVSVRGRTSEVSRLGMFGKIPKTPKAPYAAFVLEVSERKNEFLVPFSVYTYRFTEMKTVKRQNTRSDEMMEREAMSRLVTLLPTSAKFMDGFSKITRVDGGVRVVSVIETEELISQARL